MGTVSALAVDAQNGAVLSVGNNGAIRRWRPGEGEGEVQYPSQRWIWFQPAALDARDGAVLSMGKDGAVRRLPPGGGDAEVLYRHEGKVSALAVDPRDGAVLSGGWDGAVRRLLPGGGDAEVLYRHEGMVWSVAVDEFAACLFSGGNDANLRLFRLAFRDVLMLLTSAEIDFIACSLKHNRIALALGDGRLVLVRVEPSVEALLSYPAMRKNSPPDASSR